MRVSLLQMDVKLGEPEYNWEHAEEMIRRAAGAKAREPESVEPVVAEPMEAESVAAEPVAMKPGTDVICLPELWDVGFFPRAGLKDLADPEGERLKDRMGDLARELGVNIAAGSAAVRRADGISNTAFFFDRGGTAVAEYDKAHLFSPMGEHEYFRPGDHTAVFRFDQVRCGAAICYDIRFPEWIRTVTLDGTDVLFVAAQWPGIRREHWRILNRARAIENQCFVVAVNACGTAEETKFAGSSLVCDPWGEILAQAGEEEQLLSCELDLRAVRRIRSEINVYRDRRPELYRVNRPWCEV